MATLLCSTSVSDVVSVVGSIINVVNGKKWLTHIYFFFIGKLREKLLICQLILPITKIKIFNLKNEKLEEKKWDFLKCTDSDRTFPKSSFKKLHL